MDGISVACQTGQYDPQQLCSEPGLFREQILFPLGFVLTFRNTIIEVLHDLCVFMGDGKTNIHLCNSWFCDAKREKP